MIPNTCGHSHDPIDKGSCDIIMCSYVCICHSRPFRSWDCLAAYTCTLWINYHGGGGWEGGIIMSPGHLVVLAYTQLMTVLSCITLNLSGSQGVWDEERN